MLAWGFPPVVGGCIWGVFVVVFLCWGCFVVCFGLMWVLFCYCVVTGLLGCGLFVIGGSFYVLVSLLGGFSGVFGWCSRLFGGASDGSSNLSEARSNSISSRSRLESVHERLSRSTRTPV